jgi:hypothetical protein
MIMIACDGKPARDGRKRHRSNGVQVRPDIDTPTSQQFWRSTASPLLRAQPGRCSEVAKLRATSTKNEYVLGLHSTMNTIVCMYVYQRAQDARKNVDYFLARKTGASTHRLSETVSIDNLKHRIL